MVAAPLMTQLEYARHRGCVKSYVAKLIKTGKIPASAIHLDGKGRKKIDAAAADLALGETIERVVARSEFDEPDGGERDEGGSAPAGDGGLGAKLTAARTGIAFYQANLARLQYEEKIGRLVSRADLEVAMQRAAEALVRDLDQIVSRADDIATAYTRAGVDGVRAFLKTLARDMRSNLDRNMRLLERSEIEAEQNAEEVAA